MANTYTITRVEQPPSDLADPAMIISGTVNGVAVSFQTWKSVYQSKAGTAISFQNWATPLLLAEYNKLQPPTTTNPPLSGWSQ